MNAGTATRESRPVRRKSGTATQARGRARVELILAAARRILVDEGYGNLTLRNVARSVGISPGNLTYYFRTKEELFRAIFESVLENYLGRVGTLIESHRDEPEEALRGFMRFLVEDARDPSSRRFHYQLWAVSQHESFIDDLRDEFYEAFWNAMRTMIADVNPDIDDTVLDRRTCELCALAEGLYVMFGNHVQFADLSESFLERYPEEALEFAKKPGRS